MLAGCTAAPPRIMQTNAAVVWVDNRTLSRTYEELRVFVDAEDENGLEDLQSLYVINDPEELVWRVDQDRWERLPPAAGSWIGYSGFTMPGYTAFPRGEYRVVLVDASGERDEKKIFLPSTDGKGAEDLLFPSLRVGEENVVVVSPYERNTVKVFDVRGSLVRELVTGARRINSKELFPPGNRPNGPFTLFIHAVTDHGTELLSGPYAY